MRFDAQEYLDDWRERRIYPKIHDTIFGLIREESLGDSFCDLCGNTGLLGQRVLDKIPGASVVGVEMEEEVVARGRAAGVAYERLLTRIDPTTFNAVLAFLVAHQVDVLIARRCLSEVFCDWQPGDWPTEFAAPGVKLIAS